MNGRSLIASSVRQYDGCRIPAEELPPGLNFTAVPKPNSIALRMAMVADDRADVVASTRWGHEWDIAAAHLIATEAGASVTNALGETLVYNGTHGKALGVLCCSKNIFDHDPGQFLGFRRVNSPVERFAVTFPDRPTDITVNSGSGQHRPAGPERQAGSPDACGMFIVFRQFAQPVD